MGTHSGTRVVLATFAVVIILAVVIAGIVFLALHQRTQTIVPNSDDLGLYQYAGCPSLNSAIAPLGRSAESTIKGATGEFRIVTSNVRWAQTTGGHGETKFCGGVFYDTDVFKDGTLLDSFRFESPDWRAGCGAMPATQVERVYDDGGGSIKMVFGNLQQTGEPLCADRATGEKAVVAHQFMLNYPSDAFTATITRTEVKNDQLFVTVATNAKYHPLTGKIGVRISLPTLIGTQSQQQEREETFSGSKDVLFVFNVTSDGGLTFTPYYTVYASTDRLSNVFGTGIFDDSIADPNEARHDRFLIAKGTGQEYLVEIQNNTATTTVISQPVVITTPVLQPETTTSTVTQPSKLAPPSSAGSSALGILKHPLVKAGGIAFGTFLLIAIIVLVVLSARRR